MSMRVTYKQIALCVRCKKDRLLSFLRLNTKLGIHTIFWPEFRLIVASCINVRENIYHLPFYFSLELSCSNTLIIEEH